MMKKILLGKKVHISDPCYDTDVWCRMVVDNVLPGFYYTYIDLMHAGVWGERVQRVVVFHESLAPADLEMTKHLGDIGVDSGQAGFFSDESYRNDAMAEIIETPPGDWTGLPFMEGPGDKWYDKMCAFTINGNENWGAYTEGVVSSSGFGDGSYPVYAQLDEQGNIVAMEIEFFSDGDMETLEETERDHDDT